MKKPHVVVYSKPSYVVLATTVILSPAFQLAISFVFGFALGGLFN